MSTESTAKRSGIERFFDSFLRESSIKWMLISGAAIIAASSLMLVTRQWSSWPVALKYFTILGYTAAAYGIGEYCGRKLRLSATSQVLRLLTLALIPIGFLSLSWLTADLEAVPITGSGLTLLLLVPATGFMLHASVRIFDEWLQGRQTTFVAAYMILCLAGALPVITQTWLAVLFSCGFWLVMTLGVIKVNRHIFWLTEEHRWPRVFGFIPVSILGALLVVLLATKTIGAIPLQWLGFGIAMLAATILMTTRTVTAVFRQRTGDLVRPLPAAIVAPLFTGLVLVAFGVLFSFYGFHLIGPTTRAVVPTAIISAGLLLATANDTRHRGFVWASLILIAIAYQTTPTLFSELVNTLKASAAQTLHEQRLPLAFYGLTYMPLLMAFAIFSRRLTDRKRLEFSRPLQQFVTVISVALIVLSLTHLKAAFLVTAISFPAFVVFGLLFRDRRYLLPAITSLVGASAMLVPFLISMQLVTCHPEWWMVVTAGLGLIMSATDVFDRLSMRIPLADASASTRLADAVGRPLPWFRMTGQLITTVMSVCWLVDTAVDAFVTGHQYSQTSHWIAFTALFVSLFLWTLRTRSYAIGLAMWLVIGAGASLSLVQLDVNAQSMIAATTIVAGVTAIVGYWVLQNRHVDISVKRFLTDGQTARSFVCESRLTAVVLPLADLGVASFATLVAIAYLPSMLWATFTLDTSSLMAGWWMVFGLMGLGAVRFRSSLATSAVTLIAPLVAGIAVGILTPTLFTYGNLPLVYALASASMLALIYSRVKNAQATMITICSLWFAGLILLGFAFLSPTTLASSALSMLAMYLLVRCRLTPQQRTGFAILASAQAILCMSLLAGFEGLVVLLPLSRHFASSCAWMLVGVVTASIASEQSWRSFHAQTVRQWSLALRMTAVVLFGFCLMSDGFSQLERLLIVASLGLAAINEWRVAVRLQLEGHVWAGLAVIALIVAWFNLYHHIPVAHWLIRSAILAVSPLALMMARRWMEHPQLKILVRGLLWTGLSIPFVVTAWSLLESDRHAVETLLIFASAMVLFVYGRTIDRKGWVIAAAVIANLGIGSLWTALSLTDPQFYLVPVGLTVIGLVELLRQDIPAKAHDPLRYLGALAILVSPCFSILGGSWLHLLSLMTLSVIVVLLAIGLRLRALVHTGAAFLLVDLVAMVIRSTIDHPGMLWVMGLLIGATVIGIAAICENHRERLLSRIRILSAELATWH